MYYCSRLCSKIPIHNPSLRLKKLSKKNTYSFGVCLVIYNFKQAKHKCTVDEVLTFAARFFAFHLNQFRSPPWCNLVLAPFGHRLIISFIALIRIFKFCTGELILASLFKVIRVSVYCSAAYQKQFLTFLHVNILKRSPKNI